MKALPLIWRYPNEYKKGNNVSGGFVGLFSKFGAYQKWCRTTSSRAQYFEKTLEMCGLIDDLDCPKAGHHRELERAEIKKSEDAVQNVMPAINNFTNPFTTVDKDHLYRLASGVPASAEVERDVLCSEMIGPKAEETFIQERLKNGQSKELFFHPIRRQKLETMDAPNKTVKLTATQGKVSEHATRS